MTTITQLHLAGVRQIKFDTPFVPLQLGVQVKMFISAFIGETKFQTQTKFFWDKVISIVISL